MMLVQRSGDMLTASGPGGINEIQYAALLMMIARHTDYKPGVFSHVVANEQIYDRHIDAARELMARYSARDLEEKYAWDDGYQNDDNYQLFQRPSMELNFEKTNFYDMTIEDFELIGYHPTKPQLKLELGI